eukprot:GFYU01014463.1.p1 GENE.GFYU01014463.1~~GFYU01014463.1.p1  ORF type:complete len:215 (-),score=34.02 GFYU01014463.1:67-666(-)
MANQAQQYIAFGMPSLYLLVLALVVVIARTHLMASIRGAAGSLTRIILLFVGVVSFVLCGILLYSSAWQQALVGATVNLVVIFFAGNDAAAANADKFTVFLFGWILVLVGIPDKVLTGMFSSVDSKNCADRFVGYADVMCIQSYITALLFMTIVVIGLALMEIIIVASMAADNGIGQKENTHPSDSEALNREEGNAPVG